MASWRVGYMMIPESLWDAVNKIQDTKLVCPSGDLAAAALAAVKVGRRHYARPASRGLDRMRRRCLRRRCAQPDRAVRHAGRRGAFYFFLASGRRWIR